MLSPSTRVRLLVGAILACSAGSAARASTPVETAAATAREALAPAGYLYVSPVPGAAMILPGTNVIVRPGGRLDPASIAPGVVHAAGSRTGVHDGRLHLSDDGETIVFRPRFPFLPGESVTCTIAAGLRAESGVTFPEATFAFSMVGAPALATSALESMAVELPLLVAGNGEVSDVVVSDGASGIAAVGAPPVIRVVQSGETAPGDLFLSDIRFGNTDPSHLLIVRNNGSLAFQRKLSGRGFDFKRQGDRLTYFDSFGRQFYALDPLHAVVDSFRCGNGYETDTHELLLLPNGHALLMAYDIQAVDMSLVTPGGRPDALVTGLIVQELDRSREVVFQWRSWDHFSITDVEGRDLTARAIDYAHGNAIESDRDGNLLISSRHLNEITKIDRRGGGVLWRWGGKMNQFAFVGDVDRFSHQHAVRRLPNGNILLYDNGNTHSPPYSRAVEYALDEERKVASLVWQFRKTPDLHGPALGNAQRLPNGNTLVAWGAANPTATEVTPDGREVFEIDLPRSVYSYRAYRFEWPPVRGARLNLHPRSVNSVREGAWITAEIEPSEFNPASIVRSTLTLAGVPAAEAPPGDGVKGSPLVTARFPRDAVARRLRPGVNQVILAGVLATGEVLRGVTELRLVGPSRGPRAAAWALASKPGEWPVRLMVGAATNAPAPGGSFVMVAHDVRGRTVRRWSARPDPSGIVAWDGRAENGTPLPSGIYFVRREGAPAEASRSLRVLLIR